jgi:RNA-directed DNA polymerase
MEVEELAEHLRAHWPRIKEALLSGKYCPQPVKRVEIPKPGKRTEKGKLGIPCVVDRIIQQATLQVLQSRGGATFSESRVGKARGRGR